MKSDERKDIERIVADLLDKRRPWEEKWKLYRDNFAPSRGRFQDSDDEKNKEVNQKRYNSNPFRIADEFAAGVQAGLVSPTRQWFNLTPFHKNLATVESVKMWLSIVEEAMSARMLQTNFYDQVVDFMKEQGVFGTAAMFIEDDPVNFFHCTTLTAGEYAIGVDRLGRVDKVVRELKMTLTELANEFGEENLPKDIKKDLKLIPEQGGRSKEYELYHVILPNDKYYVGSIAPSEKKYKSVWYLKKYDDPDFLRKSGYDEFPIVVGRWRTVGSDIYGSEHPGQVALDDAMTIQDIERDARSALEHAIKPALTAPRGLTGRINAKPLGITEYDPLPMGGMPVIQRLYDVQFDYNAAEQKVALLLRNVEQAFGIDLYRMWSTDMKIGRTATEIQAREDEKAYMLGPITLKQTADVLGVMVMRIYAILKRSNVVFPAPPPQLPSDNFRIEYMSEFQLLQKRAAQSGIEAVLAFVAQYMQLQGATGQYPDVLDYIDGDQIVETIADMYALPSGIVLGDDSVEKKRRLRAKQQQAQAQAQQLQQVADNVGPMTDAMKTMSDTQMTGADGGRSSLLDQIIGSARDGSMGDAMNRMQEQMSLDAQGAQFG